MKLVLINGSPKAKESASGILLQRLKYYLVGEGSAKMAEKAGTPDGMAQEAAGKGMGLSDTGAKDQAGQIRITEVSLRGMDVLEKTAGELYDADAWVIACPLYVDCLPAHLLSCLAKLEQCEKADMCKNGDKEVYVYGIVNCGFYEGIQAEPALHVMQNWCAKAGFVWGGGVGVGGGGALGSMSGVPVGKGPMTPIDVGLEAAAQRIRRREAQDNRFVSVAFPRFLYRAAGQMGWRQEIRANGKKGKDLGRRL